MWDKPAVYQTHTYIKRITIICVHAFDHMCSKTQTKAGTATSVVEDACIQHLFCVMSSECVWVVIVDIKRRLHDYKNITLHGIPILYLF